MRVAHLSLGDFRNYRTAEVALVPGPNLLIGRNGQGKTNLVEAIAYFGSLRSHRVSSDTPLIRSGAEAAVLRMRVASGEREVLLDLQLQRDKPNRAQVNRNAVPPREIPRWFSSVAFVPEDLAIVRGEPAIRRRFMDEGLVARHPAAAGVLADYDRVVRQRTALLKSARGSGASSRIASTLSVWDDQLVALGTQIMLARQELIQDLGDPVRSAYASLVEADHGPTLRLSESVFTVSRETSSSETEKSVSRETVEYAFREALADQQPKELERGVTLVGPHRDDLLLTLNDLPVKGYASHGESWSFTLSLKLALASVLRDASSAGDPVIILDDVFAELDHSRRERLMSAVSDYEQVIITAAVEGDIPLSLAAHRVYIDKGTILDADITTPGEHEQRDAPVGTPDVRTDE